MFVIRQRHVAATFGALLFLAGCSAVQEPVTPSAAAHGSGALVMLSRAQEPAAFMDALFVGRVIADSRGCLRLDSTDQHTVIWPQGFTIAQRGESWAVLDAAGNPVGTIGAAFRLGGGEVTEVPADMLTAADSQIAAATCPGRYWMAWIPAS